MTDERMGDALWPALQSVPPGSGVVFRHHATPPAKRHAMFIKARRIAHARRLVIVAAGGMPGADGEHGGRRPLTAAAHDRGQAIRGVMRGARFLFISPIYPTRSHPGAAGLGVARAVRIGAGLDAEMIALGGMNHRRWQRIRHLGFYGWAAIDALSPDQNRKAVPT